MSFNYTLSNVTSLFNLTACTPYFPKPIRDIGEAYTNWEITKKAQADQSWFNIFSEKPSTLPIAENLIFLAARMTLASTIFYTLSKSIEKVGVVCSNNQVVEEGNYRREIKIEYYHPYIHTINKTILFVGLTGGIIASPSSTLLALGAYNLTQSKDYLLCALNTIRSYYKSPDFRHIGAVSYLHPLKSLTIGVGMIGLGILSLEQYDNVPTGYLDQHCFKPFANNFAKTVTDYFQTA